MINRPIRCILSMCEWSDYDKVGSPELTILRCRVWSRRYSTSSTLAKLPSSGSREFYASFDSSKSKVSTRRWLNWDFSTLWSCANVALKDIAEEQIHCTRKNDDITKYIFECAFLQAFYTKFYVPEKDLYPQEVENTDKLARALVVNNACFL